LFIVAATKERGLENCRKSCIHATLKQFRLANY
jgi:hypothetical protein